MLKIILLKNALKACAIALNFASSPPQPYPPIFPKEFPLPEKTPEPVNLDCIYVSLICPVFQNCLINSGDLTGGYSL